MKAKRKFANTAAVKDAPVVVQTTGTEVFVKDAEIDVLYRTNGVGANRPMLCWVIKKGIAPTNINSGLNVIVVWAEYLQEWLEVRVGDLYKLNTDKEMCISLLRLPPTPEQMESGKRFVRKFHRKEKKVKTIKAKADHRDTAEKKAKNMDPVTGTRIGTNKHAIAMALMSSKNPKTVMAEAEKLVIGFLKEKGKSTTDKAEVHSKAVGYIKWTVADNPTVYADIMTALEL